MERAERAAATSAIRIDRALRQLALVADEALASAFSAVLGLTLFDGGVPDPDLGARLGLASAFLDHARCLPVALDGDTVVLAVDDPLDDFAPAAVAARCGLAVRVVLLLPGGFDRIVAARGVEAAVDANDAGLAALDAGGEDDVARLKDLASDAPVIRLVNALIERAVEAGDVVRQRSHNAGCGHSQPSPRTRQFLNLSTP